MNDEYFVDTYYDNDDLSLFIGRDLWGYSDGDSSRYGNWGSYHSHPSRNSTDIGDGDDKPDAAVYVRAVLGFMVSEYLVLISKDHTVLFLFYCHCNCKTSNQTNNISPIFI